ncbi:LuxR C-terminal-related transcriptional regulator [Streptomyces sp. NPDC093970]|uniref:response regulator transcription factor n=1 Tax=Streptomyces sp. NPDC093970 TaxID=3155076 RepID=UPI0034246D75
MSGREREEAVSVAVLADDLVTRDGVHAYVRASGGFTLLPPDEEERADVLLALTHEVGDEMLSSLRRAATRRAGGLPRVVLVAAALSETQVVSMVRFGVVTLLPRQRVLLPEVMRAVKAAASGETQRPAELIRGLTDEIRRLRERLPAAGDPMTAFSEREIHVFQMFAEGFDTVEVAAKLCYSERTVKSIVHGTVKRLGLRNRTHAVAYGVRRGLF